MKLANPGVRVKTGDVVKATIVGNVITAYLNGIAVGTATDSTYTTGNPGMGFNLDQSEAIYADMLQYSRYPEGLFVGSEATKQALRSGIQRMQGK